MVILPLVMATPPTAPKILTVSILLPVPIILLNITPKVMVVMFLLIPSLRKLAGMMAPEDITKNNKRGVNMSELMNDREYLDWADKIRDEAFEHMVEDAMYDEMAEEEMIRSMHEHGLKY
jgi:hypothetical protein